MSKYVKLEIIQFEKDICKNRRKWIIFVKNFDNVKDHLQEFAEEIGSRYRNAVISRYGHSFLQMCESLEMSRGMCEFVAIIVCETGSQEARFSDYLLSAQHFEDIDQFVEEIPWKMMEFCETMPRSGCGRLRSNTN